MRRRLVAPGRHGWSLCPELDVRRARARVAAPARPGRVLRRASDGDESAGLHRAHGQGEDEHVYVSRRGVRRGRRRRTRVRGSSKGWNGGWDRHQARNGGRCGTFER